MSVEREHVEWRVHYNVLKLFVVGKIRSRKYFVRFIFVALCNYEKFLTTKISRFTVSAGTNTTGLNRFSLHLRWQRIYVQVKYARPIELCMRSFIQSHFDNRLENRYS